MRQMTAFQRKQGLVCFETMKNKEGNVEMTPSEANFKLCRSQGLSAALPKEKKELQNGSNEVDVRDVTYICRVDSATDLLNSSHRVLCSTYSSSYLYLKDVLVCVGGGIKKKKKKDGAIRERRKIRQEADGGK